MTPLFEQVSLYIHYATDPLIFWLVGGVFVGSLLLLRKYAEALISALSILLTATTVTILKHLFSVARPESALVTLDTYAFPSGHAAMSATTAVLLIWVLYRTTPASVVRTLSMCVIILSTLSVALSRVFIQVHTVIDILAGAGVGLIVPIALIAILKKRRSL